MKYRILIGVLLLLPLALAVSSLYDLNNDKEVNLLDLILTAKAIGTQDLVADFKADGEINIFDLILLVKNFGDVDETLPPVTPPTSPTGWTIYQNGPHATVPPHPLPDGPKYYLAPNGDDGNSGTSQSRPWKTWAHAIPKLQPGDTLVLLDGKYTVPNNGYAKVDCEADARSGTPGNPITIQALNERKAFIKGDGLQYGFIIRECSHWDIIGLHVEGASNPYGGTASGGALHLYRSFNINFRRMLTAYPNMYTNSHATKFVEGDNILYEESETYEFHRHGISISRLKNVNVRRSFVSTGDTTCPPIVDGIRPYDCEAEGVAGAGDESIAIYPSSYTIVENTIIESTAQRIGKGRGFEIHGGPSPVYDGGPGGHYNKILGSIARNTIYTGFVDTRVVKSTGQYRTTHGNIFKDVLSVGREKSSYYFFRTSGGIVGTGGTLLDGVTIFNVENIPVINADEHIGPCNDMPSDYYGNAYECAFTLRNALIFNNGGNINVKAPYVWQVENSNFYNSGSFSESTTDTSGKYQRTTQVQPTNMPPIPYYVPDNSNMKGAGKNGEDIGANILYRYENGILTNEPLWDPATGRFPCGAIVEGINDRPGESCYDVHKRLQVNPQTLPPNYG